LGCEVERKGLRTVTSNLLMDSEACFLKEGINWLAEEYIELEEVVTYLLK
jgi:ABC-2 type transport system ATP-binding protein